MKLNNCDLYCKLRASLNPSINQVTLMIRGKILALIRRNLQ